MKTTLAQANTRDTDRVGGGQPHNSNFESLCLIWTRPDHSNLVVSIHGKVVDGKINISDYLSRSRVMLCIV